MARVLSKALFASVGPANGWSKAGQKQRLRLRQAKYSESAPPTPQSRLLGQQARIPSKRKPVTTFNLTSTIPTNPLLFFYSDLFFVSKRRA